MIDNIRVSLHAKTVDTRLLQYITTSLMVNQTAQPYVTLTVPN